MEYKRFPDLLQPLSFHVLEPLTREGERLRFFQGKELARSAKATDERNVMVNPDLAHLCQDLLSDTFIIEDVRTSRISTAPIPRSVPYFRLNLDIAPSEVLKTITRKTEELNEKVAKSYGNSPVYIAVQSLDSERYVTGTLEGFKNRGTVMYPVIRGMFGHIGLLPERTTIVPPVLIQRAGPVAHSGFYRP